MICYLLLGQILEITGDSMYPTLLNKEHILAEKVSYKFADVQRGEIIVFHSPEQNGYLIIKRVIGLPGETVTIKYGLVYINGKVLEEQYLPPGTQTEEGTQIKEGEDFKVPNNTYFVLGDNRNRSIDSRFWGIVNKNLIVGRALFVYKPITKFRLLFL